MGDNHTLKTKGGHEIVFKTVMTGRDFRELEGVLTKDATLEQFGEKDVKITGVKGEAIYKWEEKAIELMVISVNGKTDRILDDVLDLPNDDYLEVRKTIHQLTEKKTD